MEGENTIPVIDFNNCSLDIDAGNLNEEVLKQTGEAICKAFHEVGFIYLKNHGIQQKKIDETFQLAKRFIELPEDVKHKYKRNADGYGWIAMSRESLNKERPHDLKESFSYLPQYAHEFPDPNKDVNGFGNIMEEMFHKCYKLSMRILEAIGKGLKLEDPYYFSEAHQPYIRKSLTSLRMLYYPPIKDVTTIEAKQIRCGEHSDWGSITLLFQDQTGGLEVISKGKFQQATPIPGTVLVNIGDLMQRWSGDYFKSTVHRVVLPEALAAYPERKSLAFFAIPDDDCEIVSLKPQEGSDPTPPIKSRDYMDMKMTAAMRY